jgi:hypothetical protein
MYYKFLVLDKTIQDVQKNEINTTKTLEKIRCCPNVRLGSTFFYVG